MKNKEAADKHADTLFWAQHKTASASCVPTREDLLRAATECPEVSVTKEVSKEVVAAHRIWLQRVLRRYVITTRHIAS